MHIASRKAEQLQQLHGGEGCAAGSCSTAVRKDPDTESVRVLESFG